MYSSNINQILLRNIHVLNASMPLFINIKLDSFMQEYINTYPQSKIHTYNTNFEDHCSYKQSSHINSNFSAQYQSETKHDLVVMPFPKSKAELNFTLSMVAHATTKETIIVIVGENKSGIKSLNKATKDTLINCQKHDAARHCLLYVASLAENLPPFTLEDWYEYYSVNINSIKINVAALPGVFSQKGLDKGTKVLLENMPQIPTGKLLDFGCGAGVIASFIGKSHPEIELNLLDVNALALESAKKTLTINQLTGNVFASNSLSELKHTYDYVVSNPPFHQGLATNYNATETFLKGIKKHLTPSGHVLIVANSFLTYEPIMKAAIGNTTRLLTQQGFTIYQCNR